jgi:hypothetical protein
MNFRILNKYLKILTGNEFGKKRKNGVTVLDHCPAHGLITPIKPYGENQLAGPSRWHRVGTPMAVTVHRALAVAQPVRLAGGLPANEVNGSSIKEERCTRQATSRAAELTVWSGDGKAA